MRYVQLRAFHFVAVEGGFSKAAAALGISQPAVSDQVRKLEEEHEVVLFNRRRRKTELTPTGEKLFDITKRLFSAEEQANEYLSESKSLKTGLLRIIADSAFHVLNILSDFRGKYPNMQISIKSGNTETVVAQLLDFQADIGVLAEVPNSSEFYHVHLSSEPIIAFAAQEHPLAQKHTLKLREILDEPLILREKGSKTRQKLELEVERRGLRLQAAIEAEGREAVRELVASGIGIGIVSAAEFGHDPRLRAIPISDCDLRMDEALICLRDRANLRLIAAFFQCARDAGYTAAASS